jgi:hypothetical protein
LTLVILLGGLGVEDQQNGLYDLCILLDVILFYGVVPKWKTTDQNQEHRWTATMNFRYFLPLFPVAYPGILFGGLQQIQLRTEDRENGDLGAVAP